MAASHPSRVRGLKSAGLAAQSVTFTSHPSRVRGLKLQLLAGYRRRAHVAPFTGAWIEMNPACPTKNIELPSRTLHGCVD